MKHFFVDFKKLSAVKYDQKKSRFAMKKWFVCLLLGLLPCGCADIQHTGHEQEKPFYKIEKEHPLGLVEKKRHHLTDRQIEKIAQYGVEISEEERMFVYYHLERKRGGYETGKAFIIEDEGEFGPFELIVDIGHYRIREIHVVKNPVDTEGRPVLDRNFLMQFMGKNPSSTFELAVEVEYALTTPDKIQPIKIAPITSEKIAKELKKWLVITKVLRLN
jgi:hypothetical protein